MLTGLLQGERPIVGAFLHARTFQLLHYFSQAGRGRWILMCSQSRDGDLMSRLEEGLGFRVARGSSGSGGARALVQMIKAQREDRALGSCLAIDGSRGPRGVAQFGTLTLAQKTGGVLLPVAASTADCRIYHKSWDRTVIPKRHAQIRILIGEPIEVAPRLDVSQLERAPRETRASACSRCTPSSMRVRVSATPSRCELLRLRTAADPPAPQFSRRRPHHCHRIRGSSSALDAWSAPASCCGLLRRPWGAPRPDSREMRRDRRRGLHLSQRSGYRPAALAHYFGVGARRCPCEHKLTDSCGANRYCRFGALLCHRVARIPLEVTTKEAAMETIDRKLVFDTPATVFVHPLRVVQSSQLSHDDKVVVLRNWKRNLEKLRDDPDDEATQQPEVDSRLAAVAEALDELHRMH